MNKYKASNESERESDFFADIRESDSSHSGFSPRYIFAIL